MPLPRTLTGLNGGFPTGAFDGAAVAEGSALGMTDADEPASEGFAAGAIGAPPMLLTYETRAFMSAAFTVSGTMPAAFIWAVGAFNTVIN
jgi:hypothetical protein